MESTSGLRKNTTGQRGDVHRGDSSVVEYLRNNVPVEHIRSIMANKGEDPRKIEKVVERVSTDRDQLRKAAIKLNEKIQLKFGDIGPEHIMRIANKFADSHNFTPVQRSVFISFIGDRERMNELFTTRTVPTNKMSKLFNSQYMGAPGSPPALNLGTEEFAVLERIKKHYEGTIDIHQNVVNQHLRYQDTALQAVSGEFRPSSHNVASHIHPVVAALFFPKINIIERRMLLTNLGRIIVSRGRAYLNAPAPLRESSIVPADIDDYKFVVDMINDPSNNMSLQNESALSNVLRRYNIQTELWKNVLNLRQGRYYSKDYTNNEISTLTGLVDKYSWYLYDSPDLSKVHDDGLFLNKLLSVFSLRPTYCQTTTVNRYPYNAPIMPSLGRTKLTPIPMINVKLPSRPAGIQITNSTASEPSLSNMLTQFEFFLEGDGYVPKNKTIVYSDQVCFVHVQRREPLPNFSNLAIDYPALPRSFVQMQTSRLNTSPVHIPEDLNINNQKFELRSVVTVDPPQTKDQLSTGSSTIIIKKTSGFGFQTNDFLYYSPMSPSTAYVSSNDPSKVVNNQPVTALQYDSSNLDEPSFVGLAKRYGSVYMYVNPDEDHDRSVALY